MKTPLILAATLSLATAGTAFAAQNAQPMAPSASEHSAAAHAPAATPAIPASIRARFHRLDRNKDGYIDAKEARHLRALHYQFKHVAKSGRMNEVQFAAWEEHRMAKHMKSKKPAGAAVVKEKAAK